MTLRSVISASIALALGVSLCCAPAAAQEDQGERDADWIFSANMRGFDFEGPQGVLSRDLDRALLRARASIRYQAIFGEGWEFDGELRFAAQRRERDTGTENETFAELNRFNFRKEKLFASPFLTFEGGRYRLQNRDSWLYDTNIEAAQVGYESTLINAQLGMASWLWDARTDVLQSRIDDDPPVAVGSDYLFFEYDYQWRYENHVGFDIVYEDYALPDELPSRPSNPDDLTVESELTWLRLSAWGTWPTDNLKIEYAANVATVSGDRRFVELGQDGRITGEFSQDVSGGIGWDFKLGARMLGDRFAVALGYAGGDGEPVVTADSGAFFQPVASSNRSAMIGERRYRYYGEVLVPRLNNISIASLWAGYEVTQRVWLEAAYHRYTQEHARSLVLSDRSVFLTNGLSSDIGQGFDVVFGGRIRPDINLLLIAGVFRGGDAFDDVTTDPDGYNLSAEIDVRW